MEALLGPHLLAAPGAPVSTQDVLDRADLVLLYFSASWCPPCKAFTPILKKFYQTCQKSNENIKIEIIFISSDKSIQTYQTYFSTMPWLSLPLAAETMSISRSLSTKLFINSIPTLVVLDKDGKYITNNAKSQVTSIANHLADLDTCMRLVESWKHTKSVPLEEANLGIVSSIYSKFKKGYQFVAGKTDEDESEDDSDKGGQNSNDNNSSRKAESDCDLTSVILEFFSEATTRLQNHPSKDYRTHKLLTVQECGVDGHCYKVPVKLVDHRQFLLQLQLQALENAVKVHNDKNETTVTAEQVQTSLRELGANDFSSLMSSSDGQEPSVEVQEQLSNAMVEMNDTARAAFARSVLCAEMKWWKQEEKLQFKDHDHGAGEDVNSNENKIDFEVTKRKLNTSTDGIEMERSVLLEFCGLCTAAVKLSEVEAYLANGTEMISDDDDDDDDDESENNDDKDESDNGEKSLRLDYASNVPVRVMQLQQMFLCAVGFEPNYGGGEMRKYIMRDEIQNPQSKEDADQEVEGAFTSFLMSMQAAAKQAMDANANAVKEGLSDQHTQTRVVDVKYSEKTVTNYDSSISDVAPSNNRMEEQNEEVQKQQLKMAAQAASLQKAIMDEISSMEEGERDEYLAMARQTHEAFTQKILSLAPGPERVTFLQSVSNEQQKLLLIHKLWNAK